MGADSGADPQGFVVEHVERAVVSKDRRIMWINHFDLLPGDPTVMTSFNAISSGVGGGLTGLVITSTATGETSPPLNGNKVVHMALQVPDDRLVTGVRVGYELTSKSSFISQIRLAQVQDPPKVAAVILDDGTDHTDAGPIHVDSTPTLIDPTKGALLLSLRLNFGNTADKIVIRSLALYVQPR